MWPHVVQTIPYLHLEVMLPNQNIYTYQNKVTKITTQQNRHIPNRIQLNLRKFCAFDWSMQQQYFSDATCVLPQRFAVAVPAASAITGNIVASRRLIAASLTTTNAQRSNGMHTITLQRRQRWWWLCRKWRICDGVQRRPRTTASQPQHRHQHHRPYPSLLVATGTVVHVNRGSLYCWWCW